MLNIMVIGSGGREHAIIKSLKQSDRVAKIYALPGNGGIAQDAECVNIGATDLEGIINFTNSTKIDFAVVAPDDPLVLGLVDLLEEKNIPCFGPNKRGAIIEGSKVFAKELMRDFNIPTANYERFSDINQALDYIEKSTFPIVIKADGLALGKGVIIATDKQMAIDGVKSIMKDKIFGASGNEIVIEEFLTGPEVSVLAFTDGKVVKPMISSMDHKRAYDNDEGLNTGGMGTICPNPYYTSEIAHECMEKIFIPTMNAMNSLDRKFKGCLYFGLMLTEKGAKVIEYNCRFGDPETQVVLPLLKTDLLTIMEHVANESLSEIEIEWKEKSSACVVIASEGYPKSYQKGSEIILPKESENQLIYVAGASLIDNKLVNTGGRVLGVTAVADSLQQAIKESYNLVSKVSFPNSFYRNDIGSKALKVIKEKN